MVWESGGGGMIGQAGEARERQCRASAGGRRKAGRQDVARSLTNPLDATPFARWRSDSTRVYRRRLRSDSLRRAFLLSLLPPILLSGLRVATATAEEPPAGQLALAEPAGARRLDPEQPVWIDAQASRVFVDGRVVLRDGALEMFACPAGTKEHESVVAVDAPALLIHTALLAVGAEPGSPARFEPEYRPPTGTEIAISVEWEEGGERRSSPAQEWVRNVDTGKAMELPFVFAGSGFWTDPDTKKNYYLAESGDLICVTNFGAAMIDVPAPSTQANEELWFEPFTERIPEVDTPVRLVLEPQAKAANKRPVAASESDDFAAAIATLKSATPGEGSTAERQAAWRTLAAAESKDLTRLLRGMRGASPLAENWLRTAVDAAAEAIGDERLPIESLRAFLGDRSGSPRARRTAYELLLRADPEATRSLLDGMLDDPSTELRFDAVARLLDRADSSPENERPALLRRALASARSLDQVEAAVAGLKELGQEVNLADELGFLSQWRVVGPFDNREERGFDVAYPPEEALDASATFTGRDAEGEQGPFGWRAYRTTDRLGEADLNAAIGGHKGAVGYAWATVVADKAQEIEVRYSSRAATKVWLNGEPVTENEVYHSGSVFDQYRATAKLRAGENQLLIKACQNEQTEPWAQVWSFSLRLTDPNGGPLDGVERLPTEESPE